MLTIWNNMWIKSKRFLCILCFVIALTVSCLSFYHYMPIRKVYITNPARSDGFGAQFQTIIYAAFYAELNNFDFVYTPFKTMEHNYDNDPSFITKKENLINIIDYFVPASNYAHVTRLDARTYIKFAEKNIKLLSGSKSLQEIKHMFRANKPVNYFNNDNFNIAVHIRRPNAHDCRIIGADIPDQVFLKIITQLKNKYKTKKSLIHLYSQGNEDEFKLFTGPNIVLHLNEPIEDTFTALALSDVLVTSPSSFSYSAALISTGEVYYLPFWHAPLPDWHIVDFGAINI